MSKRLGIFLVVLALHEGFFISIGSEIETIFVASSSLVNTKDRIPRRLVAQMTTNVVRSVPHIKFRLRFCLLKAAVGGLLQRVGKTTGVIKGRNVCTFSGLYCLSVDGLVEFCFRKNEFVAFDDKILRLVGLLSNFLKLVLNMGDNLVLAVAVEGDEA